MLYRISVAERGLTGIASIFRSRLSGLDDLLRAGTVPLTTGFVNTASTHCGTWRVLPELGGCHKCSACCFSVTAGPIALKFGMQLGTH